jgi:hypothetical protein
VKRGLAALAALLLPSSALACAACVAAADRNRTFFIMTIVLSLLPLAMIGGGLLWIARRARGALSAEFEERDSPVAAAAQAPTFSASGFPGGADAPKNADSISDQRTIARDPAPSLRSRPISS